MISNISEENAKLLPLATASVGARSSSAETDCTILNEKTRSFCTGYIFEVFTRCHQLLKENKVV